MESIPFPPEILARIVHWLYQSGDKLTATRLLISHKNPELARYCKNLEQPVVFKQDIKEHVCFNIGLHYFSDTDITVDWGDGDWEDYTGNINYIAHVYVEGVYRIRIYARKLLGLKRLHNIVEFPTIGNVISSCKKMFKYSDINIPLVWDTSNITDMSGMFRLAQSFNHPVRFNTSKCTDMHSMFNCAQMFNQEVNFDTSECRDASKMFNKARQFNRPVKFNMRKCNNVYKMFCRAIKFNQPINFEMLATNTVSYMLCHADGFNNVLNITFV